MLEKDLMLYYMSVFMGSIGFIIIIGLLYIIYKEYKKNSKELNSSIIFASLAGIFFSTFLLYTSYIVHNKINKYNNDLYELRLDDEVYKEERNIYTSQLKEYKNKLIEHSSNKDNSEKPLKPEKPERPDAPEYMGTLGDLLGGTFAPAIGLLAALVGGLAFFAQYQANQDIKKQFKLQQFESQFYEMLALHKDNMNEMKIEGYEYEFTSIITNQRKRRTQTTKNRVKKDTAGRKIFVTMNQEIQCSYLIVKKIYHNNSGLPNSISIDESIKKELFKITYIIFFHGSKKAESIYESLPNCIIDKLICIGSRELTIAKFFNDIFDEHQRIKTLHKNGNLSNNINDIKRVKNYFNGEDLTVYLNYKPFDGHQSRLGHYYRHLLSMVNHVVIQKEISYEEKRDYLKILRAQFSIYELTLLFYNYYAGYGIKWENKYFADGDLRKGNSSFFLDYRFLHNIEADYGFKDIDPFEILKNNFEKNKEKIQCKKDFDLNSDPVFELNDAFKTT